MSDHADLLRRAAEHIRDTVAALPEEHITRWVAQTLPPNEFFDDTEWWVNTDITIPTDDGRRVDATLANVVHSRADADHIALWHPGVALAVADWLDTEARNARMMRANALPRHAEAVARAVLGEEPAE